MSDARSLKKDKNQHIQVFVRVRPINSSEKIGKSCSVVEIPSSKEVLVHEKGSHSKKFTFDKAFGPSSKQIDVYNAVVNPLLEEVLAGYNCTVFAYGQTGTGKTFTMEGVNNDPTLHWQSDSSAGIIPRAFSHLFDELRTLEVEEYTVRVSFLELYNEELFDLLSSNHDTSKLRLYEDASRKGSVIIHGLEEITVHNKNEVYKILEKGSEKRQTAATLMNAHSSRSHTVFSITIHIKENNVDGEELLKTGKLNLVDLAGSENIGRSGAVDKRAKEAGSINQSLLTLGRVITALVERAPHVPYRESKLTRLLQDSLGGRTKTSIIATVSPASANYEETLSTLDYAHRAKNITNRPEINQKLSKKALLKEYTEEIERLRRDLLAAHERNGVYLAHENYNEMMALIENQTKEIGEKINHIKVLQETMETKEEIFSDLQAQHSEQTNQLHETKEKLETTTHALKSTTELLQKTEREKEEQSYLVEKHVLTEKQLLSQAQTLLSVADVATTDINKLHDKISHKRQLEQENEHLSHQFRVNVAQQFQKMETNVTDYTQTQVQSFACIKNDIGAYVTSSKREIDSMIGFIIDNIVTKGKSAIDEFKNNLHNSYKQHRQNLNTETEQFTGVIDDERKFLNDMVLNQKSEINNAIQANNMKIADNLRRLNEDVCRKFDDLLAHVNESMAHLTDCRLRERDNLYKSIAEIRENVRTESEKDAKIMEEKEKLEGKLQTFTTAFEDIRTQYEDMRLHFNRFNENMNDNYSAKCATVSRVSQLCDGVTKNSGDNYDKAVERNETLQDEIQNDIGRLRSDVESGMEENWTLAEQILVNSCGLIDNLEINVNNRCEVLTEKKQLIEDYVQQWGQKLEQCDSSCAQSLNNIGNIIVEGSNEHNKHLEDLGKINLQLSTDLSNKIDSQHEHTLDWNDKTLAQMLTIQDKINKFFNEDLRRDTPTGMTPARKEYKYPRTLITTSPHERIIQRFRELREN